MAAIGESLHLIAIGAFVICGAYLYLHTSSGGSWAFWSSPSLIRIPFLFSVAACYGYLIDRTTPPGPGAWRGVEFALFEKFFAEVKVIVST